MKTLKLILVLQVISVGFSCAQNVSSRSTNFVVDFSDPAKRVESSFVPKITWYEPLAENLYSENTKIQIKFDAECKKPLKAVIMSLKESEEAAPRAASRVTPQSGEENKISVDRTLTLQEGSHYIEIEIENIDGIKRLTIAS